MGDLIITQCHGPVLCVSWSRLARFKLLARNEVSRSMPSLLRACLLASIERASQML